MAANRSLMGQNPQPIYHNKLPLTLHPILGKPMHEVEGQVLGVNLPGLVPKIKITNKNSVAESRRPSPILCEDLGTIRGEMFPEYGPEQVRLRGVNGGYEYPVFRVRKIKNRN